MIMKKQLTQLRLLFLRFRQWQKNPLHYKPLNNESHVCLNCEQQFVGKYCPRCGQKVVTTKLGCGCSFVIPHGILAARCRRHYSS